jgi:hypothetical protein
VVEAEVVVVVDGDRDNPFVDPGHHGPRAGAPHTAAGALHHVVRPILMFLEAEAETEGGATVEAGP